MLLLTSVNYLWGVNANNAIFVCSRPCTGDWKHIGGKLMQVSRKSGVSTAATLSLKDQLMDLVVGCIFLVPLLMSPLLEMVIYGE